MWVSSAMLKIAQLGNSNLNEKSVLLDIVPQHSSIVTPYSRGCGYEVTSAKDFDHERLREVLGAVKGRFLLSYDDSPKIRELYKGFEMIEVERLNGINNREGVENRNKMFKELLIANYPIKELYEQQAD